ncbi:hypothetical protein F5144DRAFT_3859 [Chaetomium tenue]|uniref:Uncharacterized protein n=1 Tax=Chaetomium tenue TaxID=1854479 RepID=A0ACB7PKG7_9PEZI|nr:hypothetical protein F5144DRAFT_3859 [Chaetomium globosum]
MYVPARTRLCLRPTSISTAQNPHQRSLTPASRRWAVQQSPPSQLISMASLELVPRQKKAQLGDRDWEPWKDLVYTMYLVDGVELEEVVAELRRQGLDVNKGKLESKLKNWGFRKKLRPNIWRHVEHVMRDRQTFLMKATTVILSGRRIPQDKVKNETARHNPPTWIRSIPAAPTEDIPLYICTPRGSTGSLVTGMPDASQYTYPKGLPWFQFLECDFKVFLQDIEFLPKVRKPVTGALAEPDATHQLLQIMQRPNVVSLSKSQKSTLLPPVFEQIVRRSLGITVRSEEMALQLLAQKSVDRLAAQFDMVLPQAHPDENLRRATTLAGGSLPDIQVELLKILLFLVSNRFIFDGLHRGNFDGARELVALCQLSGLSQLQALKKLVNHSHQSLTMTAIIDTLFKAAVLTGAAGFASNLLNADCRLRPDEMVGFPVSYERITGDRFHTSGTPVEFALTKRYENLITVLVDAGAKLPSYRHPCEDWSLLAVAIYEDFPSTLIQFLRQNGAPINGPRFEALHAAFITGNLHQIERLVAQGADLNRPYRGPLVDWVPALSIPFANSDYFNVLWPIEDVGCLGFAASFHSATKVTRSKKTLGSSEGFAKDQDKALELCRLIYSKYRSQMDFSDGRMTADAMIIASARGYTKVIAFLYKFSASVNTPSGHLSPLYAAVRWKQVEAAQLLLRLGAHSCPPTASLVGTHWHTNYHLLTGKAKCPVPSLLQLAASQGSCELTELLIQGGVDVDEEREIALSNNKIFWPPSVRLTPLEAAHREEIAFSIAEHSLRPFQLAVMLKKWNVGLKLLQRGATATANDLFDAAAEGQLALVEQLLDAGINPSESVKDGVTAYKAALYNGHKVLAVRLAMAGAGGWDGDFASAFRILDIGHIKAHVPLSILGEPWKMCADKEGRSYLENAFLSGNEEVIMMALDLDATAYDSGALCAAVLSLRKSGQRTPASYGATTETQHGSRQHPCELGT